MAHVDEADGADRTEALLWPSATGPLPAPPIDTKAPVLPIGDLHWHEQHHRRVRLVQALELLEQPPVLVEAATSAPVLRSTTSRSETT